MEHERKINRLDFSPWWKQLLLLFSLVVLRFLFFGFEYFHQLDDFIQHHNYSKYEEYTGKSIWTLIENTGMFSFRPLAGALDLTLWSALFHHMIVGVAIISLLYALSGVLFYRLLGEYFPCSPLFLVLYGLLPLGFEGTYWMSASTRIVPGLCFAALSAFCFHRFCHSGEKKMYLGFFVSQVLCFGFYEQSMVLSLTLTGLLMIYFFFIHRKRSVCGFGFLGSLGVYYLVTSTAASAAMYSSRSEIILPSPYYFEEFLPELLGQLKQAFFHGGYHTLMTGFQRGWQIIIMEKGYLYLCLALGLSALLYFVPHSQDAQGGKQIIPRFLGVFVGGILAFAPVSAFFVIANPWFSLRGTVTSFCGIALMVDSILGIFTAFFPKGKQGQTLVAIPVAFCCLVASVSELSDYRDTYYDDLQVVTALYPYIQDLPPTEKVGVLGVETSFLPEQNFQYHEHLHGVTESDWALTGRMGQFADGNTSYLVPIPVETEAYYHYNASGKRPDLFDHLFYYHHETAQVIPLTLEVVESQVCYHFYQETGALFAILTEEEGKGTIELVK